MAVVAKGHSAFFCHIAQLCQFLALFALADGADNFYVYITFAGSAFFNAAYDNAVVYNRFGIRHAGNGCYAACCCCHSAGNNIFFCFKSRLTQMCMHINKPRSNHKSGSIINFIGSCFDIFINCSNNAVFNKHVHYCIKILRRVNHTSVFN